MNKEEARDGKERQIRDETNGRWRKKAADDSSKIDIGIIVRFEVPRQASV